ncbi:hypothetical protein [Methylomonas sp. MgM2]
MARIKFNLERIEQSLREVQKQMPLLNRKLEFELEHMSDEVIENLVSGYALINHLLTSEIELLAIGSSSFLLELNTRVLCGVNETKRSEYRKHIQATNRYFYDRTGSGIQSFMEWYDLHRYQSTWQRAAGAYVHILSEPQLFIEGNNRTATLIMSYILASEGLEPFVLTVKNAKAFFELSALVKTLPGNALLHWFRLPFLKNDMAGFLKNQLQTRCWTQETGL